jgi:hypothetical protein
MDSHEREPCPHRIIDDLGGAFAFGAVSALLLADTRALCGVRCAMCGGAASLLCWPQQAAAACGP